RLFVTDWSIPRTCNVQATVRNNTPGPLSGALWIVPLAVADDDYEPLHLSFVREDEQKAITLAFKLPILKPPPSADVLLEFGRETPAASESGVAQAAAGSPPAASSLTLASARIDVVASGIRIPEGSTVGHISGLDSSLSIALTEFGVEHSEI